MRIYAIKTFRALSAQRDVSDAALIAAVDRAEEGSSMPISGEDSSSSDRPRRVRDERGGYRTIIAYRAGQRICVSYRLWMSQQNERDELPDGREWRVEGCGRVVLEGDDNRIAAAIAEGELTEVEQ